MGEGHSIDAMLRAGAVAVVPKERATEDLYDAIQRAIALLHDSQTKMNHSNTSENITINANAA